jgi:mycofactocin precursor
MSEAIEAPAEEVVEDLLVEEVSIDGMCGVY